MTWYMDFPTVCVPLASLWHFNVDCFAVERCNHSNQRSTILVVWILDHINESWHLLYRSWCLSQRPRVTPLRRDNVHEYDLDVIRYLEGKTRRFSYETGTASRVLLVLFLRLSTKAPIASCTRYAAVPFLAIHLVNGLI